MGVRMRLPRVVNLGGGYRVRVVLAPQRAIQEVAEESNSLSGHFDNSVDRAPSAPAGTIYVLGRLPAQKKRETYWAGLQHAVLDVTDWDREHGVASGPLPRALDLGLGHRVRVFVSSVSALREFLDDDEAEARGACDVFSDDVPRGYSAVVHVLRSQPSVSRWDTYWHEIQHVVASLSAWDREHPVVV